MAPPLIAYQLLGKIEQDYGTESSHKPGSLVQERVTEAESVETVPVQERKSGAQDT